MALERLRLVRPAQRAEWPEGGREPGIQHIGVAIENGFRRMMSDFRRFGPGTRSEEHTSELQSLMRTSYAVFCLKKKNTYHNNQSPTLSQSCTKHKIHNEDGTIS